MRYEAPETLERAAGLLAAEAGTTRILAGGTDVLVQLRAGVVEPDLVVDIKRAGGVGEITPEDGGWRIGAAVPGAAIGEHEGLCRDWPGVVEAIELIGSTQVQARATPAGNLCNASPAADSVPAMIAAAATARIVGPGGTRDVAVEEIPAGPGKTTLAKGEIISSIFLPARPPHASDAYLRFIPRTEMDIAVVGCGIDLVLEGNRVARARVALGAVAPRVLLVADAAAAITGTTLDDAALEALAAACSAACNPIDDKRGTIIFRQKVAGVLARRAARIAYDRAKGRP